MNPYYTPPYMQQPQPIQQLPQQHMEQRVVSYFVDSADIFKDIAKADAAMSKACYYDSKNDWSGDKRY